MSEECLQNVSSSSCSVTEQQLSIGPNQAENFRENQPHLLEVWRLESAETLLSASCQKNYEDKQLAGTTRQGTLSVVQHGKDI